jgi:hypothetical protein
VQPPSICKPPSLSNSTNKNIMESGQIKIFKQFYFSNHSQSGTCLYKLYITVTDTIRSQNTDLSSWSTLFHHDSARLAASKLQNKVLHKC